MVIAFALEFGAAIVIGTRYVAEEASEVRCS